VGAQNECHVIREKTKPARPPADRGGFRARGFSSEFYFARVVLLFVRGIFFARAVFPRRYFARVVLLFVRGIFFVRAVFFARSFGAGFFFSEDPIAHLDLLQLLLPLPQLLFRDRHLLLQILHRRATPHAPHLHGEPDLVAVGGGLVAELDVHVADAQVRHAREEHAKLGRVLGSQLVGREGVRQVVLWLL